VLTPEESLRAIVRCLRLVEEAMDGLLDSLVLSMSFFFLLSHVNKITDKTFGKLQQLASHRNSAINHRFSKLAEPYTSLLCSMPSLYIYFQFIQLLHLKG